MRARTGHIIGTMFVSCNPNNTENPIKIELEGEPDSPYGWAEQPLDVEDAEHLIKVLRSMIRRVKNAA